MFYVSVDRRLYEGVQEISSIQVTIAHINLTPSISETSLTPYRWTVGSASCTALYCTVVLYCTVLQVDSRAPGVAVPGARRGGAAAAHRRPAVEVLPVPDQLGEAARRHPLPRRGRPRHAPLAGRE